MATPREKQVLLDIIEKYKNMPLLWDREHKDYKSFSKRSIANKKLLEIYKKLDDSATTQTVTKKILNLRTHYFKELRKVKESLTADDGVIYEPTIWYFDAFNFLDDNASNTSECSRHEYRSNESYQSQHSAIIKSESLSSLSCDEEGSYQNTETHSPVMSRRGSAQISETQNSPPVKMRKFTNPIVYKNTNNSLESAAEPSQIKNEECEIFGKAIGLQLRDLDKQQLTIVQKLISDTIYYARFGLLSQNTYINLGDPPNNNMAP